MAGYVLYGRSKPNSGSSGGSHHRPKSDDGALCYCRCHIGFRGKEETSRATRSVSGTAGWYLDTPCYPYRHLHPFQSPLLASSIS